MPVIITTDDLVSQTRSRLDENNRTSVTDADDIIPALNRAQSYAANIMARHYESPMLRTIDLVPVNGQKDYQIPENAFEERLEKVEVIRGNLFYPLKRISYRDITAYEYGESTSFPYYYAVINNYIRILPNASSSYPLRLWFLEAPEPIVPVQGRINIVNSDNNYVILNSVGADLTTESDNLNSFVSVIDGQSGKKKATFQVQNIVGNKVTFKTVPTRSTVNNVSIDTSISDLIINQDSGRSALSVNPDDFICIYNGTCVPFFKQPTSNFIIEYAIAEIQAKLGGDARLSLQVLEKLEQQVERSWVGRESTLRVNRANKTWGQRVRRYWGIGNK